MGHALKERFYGNKEKTSFRPPEDDQPHVRRPHGHVGAEHLHRGAQRLLHC